MHLPTLQKLLTLFISGSILISSVPVYAAGTTSLIEPAISEEFAEPDNTADNSDEEVNGSFADEDVAGENRTDTVDENRETPAGLESETATSDGNNIPDSETTASDDNNISDSEAEGDAASIDEGSADSDSETFGENDTKAGDSDTSGENDTKAGGSDIFLENDTKAGGSDTSGEKTDDTITVSKKESFTHRFYKDVNDPAYDELRKELDTIFQNAQLTDTTDLPVNYSLVSLPFGGEGSGGSTDRSAPIKAAQGRDLLMPVYDQGVSMNTCWSFTGTGIIESYLIRNQYAKLGEQGIELSKWQVPFASSKTVGKDTVIGGYHVDPTQYGEGIGQDLNNGGTPSSYGQAVTSWAGLDYEKNVPTPRVKTKMTELTPAQIDQAVVRGRDALYLPTPTPNMAGHEGYDKKIDPREAVVYDPAAVAAIKNCLMKLGPVYAEICYQENEPAKKGGINKYENWEYGSMYYPLWTDDTIASHAVTIVG